ncbi:MAG: FtsQ-type POTRA domain-containing protein [Oscillospiraceae bacterium]|nr:FtsQ-type POTRA domain-containing protein [Oscillospiraceae bacterium]
MLFKRGSKKPNNTKPGSPRSTAPQKAMQKPAQKPPVQPDRPPRNMQKPPVQPNKPQGNPQRPPVQPVQQNKPQPNRQKPVQKPVRFNKHLPGAADKAKQKPVRKKFRGGNYALYYVLGVIVLIIAFVILANTVLFKCRTISVSGNDNYDSDEIILASGINIGDNLVKLKPSKAADSIVSSLAYIDAATVKKSYPTKINITVTEAEKYYCVVADGTTAAVSRRGKIIEHCEAGKLPIVKGYEPETLEVGAWLASKTDGKSDIPAEVFAAAEKAGLKNITVVDVSDKFNIEVIVEDRVILKLGTSDDVVSKLLVAVEIIENQLGETEYVTLILTNPEKVPAQTNPNPNKPVSSSSKPASSTTTTSSEAPETPEYPEDPEPEEPEEPESPEPEEPEAPE